MNPTTNEREAVTASKTTAEIEPGDATQVVPEWGRLGDVERIFGVKRGLCYQLIAAGKIKSACLRRKDSRTGIRLIHLPSVAALIESNVE